jgi:hypothetical protein
MTLVFIAAASVMLTVTLLLILSRLSWGNFNTLRRLRESRAELRALHEACNDCSDRAGAVDHRPKGLLTISLGESSKF